MEWWSNWLFLFYPAQLIFDIMKKLLVVASIIQNLFTLINRLCKVIISLKQTIFLWSNWVSIEVTFVDQVICFLSDGIDTVLKKSWQRIIKISAIKKKKIQNLLFLVNLWGIIIEWKQIQQQHFKYFQQIKI